MQAIGRRKHQSAGEGRGSCTTWLIVYIALCATVITAVVLMAQVYASPTIDKADVAVEKGLVVLDQAQQMLDVSSAELGFYIASSQAAHRDVDAQSTGASVSVTLKNLADMVTKMDGIVRRLGDGEKS